MYLEFYLKEPYSLQLIEQRAIPTINRIKWLDKQGALIDKNLSVEDLLEKAGLNQQDIVELVKHYSCIDEYIGDLFTPLMSYGLYHKKRISDGFPLLLAQYKPSDSSVRFMIAAGLKDPALSHGIWENSGTDLASIMASYQSYLMSRDAPILCLAEIILPLKRPQPHVATCHWLIRQSWLNKQWPTDVDGQLTLTPTYYEISTQSPFTDRPLQDSHMQNLRQKYLLASYVNQYMPLVIACIAFCLLALIASGIMAYWPAHVWAIWAQSWHVHHVCIALAMTGVLALGGFIIYDLIQQQKILSSLQPGNQDHAHPDNPRQSTGIAPSPSNVPNSFITNPNPGHENDTGQQPPGPSVAL